jgi:hypothetical protein
MSAQYYSKGYQQPHYRSEHQQSDQYPQQGSSPQQGYPQGYQPIIIQQPQSRTNGLGITGFVLALLGLLLIFIPVINWIFDLLGFIFSFIGIFKAPRGFAIAGLIISIITSILAIIYTLFLAEVGAGFLGLGALLMAA